MKRPSRVCSIRPSSPDPITAVQILIVDDQTDYRSIVAAGCVAAGHKPTEAENAEQAFQMLEEAAPGAFDAVLLDLEMPGASGFDVLHSLREAGDEIPILIVSGREDVESRVKALRMGADDYLTKPVDNDELFARVDAVVRRRLSLAPVDFGCLRMDLARRKVERSGKRVDLSPREYDLLLALVRADGEVMARKKLLFDVWDLNFDPGTNVLDVHVGRVRKKLDRHGPPLIETVRGKGYRARRLAE